MRRTIRRHNRDCVTRRPTHGQRSHPRPGRTLSATVPAVVLRVPTKVDAFNALIKVRPFVRYVRYFFRKGAYGGT